MTDEPVSDGPNSSSSQISQTITFLARKVEATIADGAFDWQEIFDYLHYNHIQPVIIIRPNAPTKSRGSPSRAKAAKELQDIGLSSVETKIWLRAEIGDRNRTLVS